MHIEDIQLCKENQNGGGWGGEKKVMLASVIGH